jgi:PTS system nitrogen regulatory IIA component
VTSPLPPRAPLVFADVSGGDGRAVLRALAAELAAAGAVPDGEELFRRLWEREQLGSTGVGGGVAIPHCKLAGLDGPILAVALARQAVAYGAPDGQPVKAFFVVVSPSDSPAEHLRSLALISRWLKSDGHAEKLVSLGDPESVHGLLGRVGAG